jgi:hypothetical protein
MTFLRHAGRHVHKTVLDYLTAQLDDLGWRDAATTPFGATPVTIISRPVYMGDKLDATQIAPGVVAVTLGDEGAPSEEELGGPLSLQEYPIFVDVFGDNEATTLALATDIKDIFMGRFEGSQRFLRVKNGSTGVEVAGWRMEFEDVERVRPETSQPYHWQVVKVTATTYFPEVVY